MRQPALLTVSNAWGFALQLDPLDVQELLVRVAGMAPKVHDVKDVSVEALARKQALQELLALLVLLYLGFNAAQTKFDSKGAENAQVRPVWMPNISFAAQLSFVHA